MGEFPKVEDYVGPTIEELVVRCDTMHPHLTIDVSNPHSLTDNRDSIRMLMHLLQMEGTLVYRMVCKVWDNGFYKKSDGKSTFLTTFKTSRLLKNLHISIDPVSVVHDWRYYTGEIPQKKADREFLKNQKDFGQARAMSYIEYMVLRGVGWRAYNKHKHKRETIPGYGTEEYIPKLLDSPRVT